MKITFDTVLSPAQLNECAEWISATGELEVISGELGTLLEPQVLDHWVRSSVTSLLLKQGESIKGLATLTTAEATLPDNSAEICHLIVHPEFRREYHGTSLLKYLVEKAIDIGFTTVYGRVSYDNPIGEQFLHALKRTPVTDEEFLQENPGFKWFNLTRLSQNATHEDRKASLIIEAST